MSGGSDSQTVGYRYFMGLHFGVCHGPIDMLRRILVGDRMAWGGEQTTSGSLYVNAPELFGGDDREGGIAGPAEVMMGEQTQTLPSAVAAVLPSPAPAFRGIFSLFYRGQISANNPYVKPFAFKVQRIFAGWHGGTAWYPEKAAIGTLTPGTKAQTLLQSRFVGASAADESDYQRGAPVQSGGELEEGVFRVDRNNSEMPNSPSVLTYQGTGLATDGAGALTFEFFATWEATPNISYTVIASIQTDTSNSSTLHKFGYTGDEGRVVYDNSGVGAEYTTPSPVAGKTHFAIVFAASGIRAYIGGQRVWQIGTSGIQTAAAMRVKIGDEAGYDSAATRFTVSGFRVTQSELYTGASFTPPTSIPDPDASSPSTGDRLMNPAHIIYQCLTDPTWGMGYPVQSIDTVKFTAAADTLYAENFGLCLLWNKQEELGTFIRTVLDHIGALLYSDPKTGKFGLKLIRADYDAESLDVFDESNIVALESFQRVGYGDTVNEITVVYRDADTNKDTPITVQNLANVQAQGAVVSQTRQYPGVPNVSLALRVAQRDLIAASTPLAKARLRVNREAWSKFPGDVFRLSWPKLGITAVVMRVLGIDYGTLQDGTILVDAAEDVFGLPESSYAGQEPMGWEEPVNTPVPVVEQEIIEAPYRSIVAAMTATELAAVDSDAAYLCAVAAKPSADASGFEIYTRVGSAGYARQASGQFVPAGELAAGLSITDGSITLAAGAVDIDLVQPGTLAIIGSGQAAEWVKVVSINAGGLTATIERGMLDTVPKAHLAGAAVWFDDGRAAPERVERATGETVDFRLLTKNGSGTLALSAAETISGTAAQRQFRPYPPGNVRINGLAYPATAADALTITWAHRDRLQQTAGYVGQGEGDIGPEAGTTYSVELRNATTDSVVASAAGLAGTSFAPTINQAGSYPLRVQVWALRGGLESWQRHDFTIDYTNSLSVSGGGGTPMVVRASQVFPVAGASLALAYTQAPATASPGAAMVRFFTPSLTLAEPVPAGQTFVINFGSRANNAGPIYYIAQYQTTAPTSREPIVTALKEQIEYLLANTTAPRLADYIELVNISDYLGTKWLHIIGQFGVEFMAEGTGVPDPPGVTRPTVTGNNTSMISWADGSPVVPADLPQLVTATISGTPNPGDLYTITLNGTAYSYTAQTTDSAFDVIAGLAAAIDAAPSFAASAAGATLTISGVLPSNVFTYSSSASGARAFGAIAADPNWASTTFLLNTNGPDNSTTFTDASTGAHSITALANAKIVSNRAVFDMISTLRVPNNSGHHFGSGDFTVEARGDFTNQEGTGDVGIAAVWKTGSISWFFGINNSKQLVFYYSTDGTSGTFTAVTSVSVPSDGDFEVAVTRASGVLRLFIAGVKRYEATHSATFFAPGATPLTIGGVDYSAPMLSGNMVHRRMRITKGVARYTADYTPTSGPFGVG